MICKKYTKIEHSGAVISESAKRKFYKTGNRKYSGNKNAYKMWWLFVHILSQSTTFSGYYDNLLVPLYLVLSYLSCTCTLVYLYWNPLQANSTRTCLFLELYYSSTFMYYSSIKVYIFWVAKASYKQNYVIHPHSLLQLYSFLCY